MSVSILSVAISDLDACFHKLAAGVRSLAACIFVWKVPFMRLSGLVPSPLFLSTDHVRTVGWE